MIKVLVTGASGFIGSSVLKVLRTKSFEIHAVGNATIGKSTETVMWHKVNLLDEPEVSSLFARIRPDYLIQLAWCTGQGSYWTDPSNLEWITANLNIAKHFVAQGGKRCLFAGTSAEYDWSSNEPLNENATRLTPHLLYGGCKLGLYWALRRYFTQEKISFVWTRFFNPFGEGEDSKRLVPKTCLSLLSGKQLQFDAALSLRDFLHVEDVAEASVHLLLSEADGAVNVGSGVAITVKEVVSTIARYYNLLDNVTFAPFIGSPVPDDAIVADTTRLNIEYGWVPVKTFTERMSHTCEWWKLQYKKQHN